MMCDKTGGVDGSGCSTVVDEGGKDGLEKDGECKNGSLLTVGDNNHLVDVRSVDEFTAGHIPDATNIPASMLPDALCALPPRDTSERQKVTVVASNDSDLAFARDHIASARYDVTALKLDEALCTSTAPSRRLWRPNCTLERAAPLIEDLLRESKMELTALDVACGSARDSVFLAIRGWTHVRGIDNNPRLLGCGRVLAKLEGVKDGVIDLDDCDVERYHEKSNVSEKTYSLVHVARFLDRGMFVPLAKRETVDERSRLVLSIPDVVAPGGFIVYHTFTEPSVKPSKPKHVLKRDELAQVFGTLLGWEILFHEECRLGDGRIVQTICARKPL